jgi:hypothetical protein
MNAFLHRFLTSALDGHEWSLSYPRYPWVGPMGSLDSLWTEDYLVLPGIEPRLLVRAARNPVVTFPDVSCIIRYVERILQSRRHDVISTATHTPWSLTVHLQTALKIDRLF